LVFKQLSVEDNLKVGAAILPTLASDRSNGRCLHALSSFARKKKFRSWMVVGGEQQMLALGRALIGRPRFVIG
jgi:branched-chain amino acid transport system ATP-binding protein